MLRQLAQRIEDRIRQEVRTFYPTRQLIYRTIQVKRERFHQERPERVRQRLWSQQAAVRQQNPQWRRAFDGSPNPLYEKWGLDPISGEKV